MEQECNICLKKVPYPIDYHCNECKRKSMEKWFNNYNKKNKLKKEKNGKI